MEYLLMSPPFEIKDFDKMSKSEAKEHFNWYTKEIPNRVKLLNRAIEITDLDLQVNLDYKKESLVALWKWYLNNVEVVEKTNEEIDVEIISANKMTKQFVRKGKIATGWLAVAMDISIYFAECLIKEHQELTWGVVTRPKSLAYVNKPVVVGFSNGMELDATNILFVQTRKILKGVQDEQALQKLFENWEKQL